ncbi:MAG: cytochrome ubiquinol oxidase subunit I [Pseudomonadota bacterium]
MDGFFDALFLSRLQFGLTTAFHILWSSLSIGLAFFLVIVEVMWIKTGDEDYYRHARFWGRLFVLVFAMGVVTGFPLGFQFGTNWSEFSKSAGGFFGNLLSFEAAMAFMLESAFLGIMLFGWDRVSRGAHLFATIMVACGASLSAFWIMVANSWMQSPAGGVFENGRFIIKSYYDAIFNPDWFLGFSHMWIACLETGFFVVGGLSAWNILIKRRPEFFAKAFRVAVAGAILVAPLQFLLGDASGRLITAHRPAKLAAVEAHWETNQPGEDAGWNALAWPNVAEQKNDFQIRIPWGLSLLLTHSLTGQVVGLRDIPRDEHPPILLIFYSFRLMMAIGFGMIFLSCWTIWLWFRGRLRPEAIAEQKQVLFLWVLTIPLGYLATAAGWMTREVGRQPWVIYGLLKTGDASSDTPAPAVGLTLLGFAVVYTVIFFVFLFLAQKVFAAGPDFFVRKEK